MITTHFDSQCEDIRVAVPAPISANQIFSYGAEHVLGLPRNFLMAYSVSGTSVAQIGLVQWGGL